MSKWLCRKFESQSKVDIRKMRETILSTPATQTTGYGSSFPGNNVDTYQSQRHEDNGTTEFEHGRVIFALGIAGEAGEVADYMKKVIGHGKEFDRQKLVDELGDVIWYTSQLAAIHGIKMSEILNYNTAKLRDRYPTGFDGTLPHWTERSL